MRRAIGLTLLLVLLCVHLSRAQGSSSTQSVQERQYTQLQQVLTKLQAELENVPFSIQRIATQQLRYDSTRFTTQGFRLIKHEIERVFREHGRINVLSLEEFDAQKVLYISGTDSTLTLRNTSKSPSENENSIRLLELSQKYNIDAFMKGNIQYKTDLGYVITLELISPTSREVLWSKSLISKELQPEEESTGGGKLTLLSAGASLMPTAGYRINGIPYTGQILFIDYTFRVALRQPINDEYSGYIGVQGGYHYYNVIPAGQEEATFETFGTSVFEVGGLFYKTIAEKSHRENEYWLSLFMGPNLLIPSNSINLFSLTQGVNVNVSDNIGVTLDFQYLLSSNPYLENEDETKNVQLKTIGYGLKVLFRL